MCNCDVSYSNRTVLSVIDYLVTNIQLLLVYTPVYCVFLLFVLPCRSFLIFDLFFVNHYLALLQL